MKLIGSGGGSEDGGELRRIPEDVFKNLAMEAKINAVKILIQRKKDGDEDGVSDGG